MKNHFYTIGLFLSTITLVFAQSKTDIKIAKNQSKPNIILILADDMGYSDIGSYGSEINTPNIDRLAAEGVKLKQCYNNGICAPSRASLLTGQYPHKAGIGFFNQDLGLPAYQGFLNKESLTIAEVLKDGGYSTFMAGKWHVGNAKSQWPLQRGFDKFFGFIDGAESYFDSNPIFKGPPQLSKLYEGNEVYQIKKTDFYLTDELTDKGLDFLKQNPKEKPFFLYMAYNAPHWPLHAKPQDIEKYKGKYDIGWDTLRSIRHQNLIKIGLVDANQKAVKDNSLPAWNKLTYNEKQFWVKKMEVYAAMVDNLDQNVGRIIDYLKTTNQLDNTVILFLSDNGAEDWDFSKLAFAINRSTGAVGTAGSNESYTKNWAQVSNMPLRSYKSSPYEGGVSSPFIIRYPKLIPANTIEKGGIHIIDIMPTILELTHTTYPSNYNGTKPNTLLGESFLKSTINDTWERKKPICYEWAGNRAVWNGNWKAVSKYPENKWELYDLKNDRTESTNLASKYPQVLTDLDMVYQKWTSANSVETWSEELAKKTKF